MNYACPVCGKELQEEGKVLVCENKHLFDKAKKGYVNLLMSNSSKTHGDTKEMLKARENFLELGHYEKLKKAVCDTCKKYASNTKTVVDCGCGEGYYTQGVSSVLPGAEIFAIDIAKDALILAKRRQPSLKCAVASTYNLPLADECADLVLNLFSPLVEKEFHRVLKKGGKLIRVIPLEKHLWELKKVVYESPYENEVKSPELQGFSLLESEKIQYKFEADNRCLKDLFLMTPYSLKTSPQDKEKLDKISTLTVSAQFEILTYTKE